MTGHDAGIAIGWRVRSWSNAVVAVSGPATAPQILLREQVTLIDDASLREPYHVAAGLPLEQAPALIESVEKVAAAAAAATLRKLASSLGGLAAVGVVGGDRRLPELSRILTKHALWHAAERDLHEQAFIEGATRLGLPVTTVPATGALFDRASDVLGVVIKPTLAALGKSIGPPWRPDHREAAAAALVALAATR